MIGRRIGPYEVVAKLGEGGMGVVYRASDSRLKRDVALKVLPAVVAGDPTRLARFQREAELLASLNHPNIAHVHGLEEAGGVTALVMELVDGDDLAVRIAAGPMPVPQALHIGLQVAAALEAAHEQGVIHRDLKPGNIKVRPDGAVKVLDFGLAKSLAQPETATPTVTAMTSPGLVMGTPAYMSPEQARGEATGRETDVWAFAVVLYEMLTGASPFARPSAAETIASVLGAPLDESRLPPATPAGVRRLLRRCLERDPKRRWRHLGDARLEIEEALASPSEAPRAPSSAPAPVSRRRAIVFGAASLGLAAAGFGAGRWLDPRGPTPLPTYRRLTFRRGLIRSARVAPDGQTIFYGALWDDDQCRVHAVRIDGPESRAIEGLPHANLLAVSRRGELAVALGSHERGIITYGTLATVPMVGGAPREMLADVKFADWSPDGTEMAIVRQVDGRDRLEYPVGTPLVAPRSGERTGLGFPRISPDGTQVAYVHYAFPTSLNGQVSVVDRVGSVKALSAQALNIHGLAWRGSEILYTASDDRPLFRSMHAVSPAGVSRTVSRMAGNITLWDSLTDGRLVIAQTDDRSVMIAREGDRERDFSWLDSSYIEDVSRDGRAILFSEFGQGGGPDGSAYLRRVDGSPAIRLQAGRAVALSPDGRHAICFSTAFGPATELHVVPTAAGETRRIPGNGLTFTGARWLPDGGRIVVSALEAGGRPRVFVHDLGQGQPKPITPEGVDAFVVSPEGSTIAARGSGAAIRLYGVDGSAPRDVPGLDGLESPVGWITQGLLVMRTGDPKAPIGQIYRIDVKTGRQDPWDNILPRDRTGIMSFGRFRTSPDGRSHAYTWHRALSHLYLADGLT